MYNKHLELNTINMAVLFGGKIRRVAIVLRNGSPMKEDTSLFLNPANLTL